MAIEEFGQSLLSNVRQRQDEIREREVRRAEKQEDDSLVKGLGILAAGKVFSGVSNYINLDLFNKTNDFMSKSNLYDAKLNVNKAAQRFAEYDAFNLEAQNRNLSFNDLGLEKAVDTFFSDTD